MTRSNGQDLNEPLGSRTAPLGVVGLPRSFAEQSRDIATQEPRRVSLGDEVALQEAIKAAEARSQSLVAELRSYMAAFAGTKPAASPYVPERATGPVQFFSRLLNVWDVDKTYGARFLGFEDEDASMVEGVLSGRVSLRGRDAKDRVAILFRIRSLLAGLFRDVGAERTWLRTPRPEFYDRSPLDLLKEGSMENLLRVRQFVEQISGQ